MSAGPDHPDYSMLIKGPRGSGKTVLLAAMRDAAEQNGFKTIKVTAKPEPTFADVLIEHITAAHTAQDTGRSRISTAQFSVLGSGAGVSMQAPEARKLQFTQECLWLWSNSPTTFSVVLVVLS